MATTKRVLILSVLIFFPFLFLNNQHISQKEAARVISLYRIRMEEVNEDQISRSGS